MGMAVGSGDPARSVFAVFLPPLRQCRRYPRQPFQFLWMAHRDMIEKHRVGRQIARALPGGLHLAEQLAICSTVFVTPYRQRPVTGTWRHDRSVRTTPP
jgi:hypothetical protein